MSAFSARFLFYFDSMITRSFASQEFLAFDRWPSSRRVVLPGFYYLFFKKAKFVVCVFCLMFYFFVRFRILQVLLLLYCCPPDISLTRIIVLLFCCIVSKKGIGKKRFVLRECEFVSMCISDKLSLFSIVIFITQFVAELECWFYVYLYLAICGVLHILNISCGR